MAAQLQSLLGSILLLLIVAEGFCMMLSLPYHPLAATGRAVVRGAVRLAGWLVRQAVELVVRLLRAIVTAIVEGIRDGVRRRARP